MGKLQVLYNKSLKLTNACIREILSEDLEDLANLENIVIQMENYIRAKGALPIGPVIQAMQVVTDHGESDIRLQLIRQTNTFLKNLEQPYSMQSVLRCKNCLFVRFMGEEYQLKYAYDKLNLVAFEEGIPLTGRSYTVFTSKEQDVFSADVFMEKA